MENAHIVKSFDQDLAQIEALILEMGGMVENQIMLAIKALISRDEELAKSVRAADKAIDAVEVQVDELALRILAQVIFLLSMQGAERRNQQHAESDSSHFYSSTWGLSCAPSYSTNLSPP